MNFVKAFKDGKAGFNKGQTTGIPALDRAINGIQKKTSIGICAAPKCGKTTFVDFSFVISPYLSMLKQGILDEAEWIYFSYEIDRVSKEFKYASFFMYYDFGVERFTFNDTDFEMSPEYLMGKLLYEKEPPSKENNWEPVIDVVPVLEEHEEMLKQIYRNRIVPLFGEYDEEGNQIKAGKIIFFEEADNPTGMYKYLLSYARLHGRFIEKKVLVWDEENKKHIEKVIITGYKENNSKKKTYIITDHIRKLKLERGFIMKQNIDKWLEYTTFLRNMCLFTFINVAHSNRGVTNVERLKLAGEWIFPTADDVKDSGNLAEESTILMTLFNPHDEKYNLTRHMGVELANNREYRSLHITESRNTPSPAHIQVNMRGGINYLFPCFPQ